MATSRACSQSVEVPSKSPALSTSNASVPTLPPAPSELSPPLLAWVPPVLELPPPVSAEVPPTLVVPPPARAPPDSVASAPARPSALPPPPPHSDSVQPPLLGLLSDEQAPLSAKRLTSDAATLPRTP